MAAKASIRSVDIMGPIAPRERAAPVSLFRARPSRSPPAAPPPWCADFIGLTGAAFSLP
ncbi:hypothetical protein GCM10009837_30600 [Streptomyces durmitorensis]